MSRLSLKKDFKDGEVLYGNQVNTNNKATELAVNDNYEEILNLKDTKADSNDMTDALALKVNTSTFNEAIDSLNTTKANVSLVNTKADKTALALKADKTYVDGQLETKATISYVDSELTVKADSSDVDTALLLKADKATTYTKTETDAAISSGVTSGTTGKADKTYVDTQLATKASSSSLGNISNLNTENKTSVVAAINEVNNATKDIDELSITANSSNKIQASGIIDGNSNNVVRTWVGTTAQYNDIETKNASTLYYISDDYAEPEIVSHKTTSITSSSTDTQYPSAKAVYDYVDSHSGGGGTTDYSQLSNKPSINSVELSGNKTSSDLSLQDALVSGTNIKTINSTSLLGSGNIAVQETLNSGTNIKTINSTSLLGSGNIDTEIIQYSTMPTASASNEGKIVQFTGTTDSTYTNGYFYKCVSDGESTPTYSWANIGVQDLSSKQDTLVSGTNIKTINSTSLLGSGDITISGGSLGDCIVYHTDSVYAPSNNIPNGNPIIQQILSILNECYEKNKRPILIVGNNGDFPVYLVGHGIYTNLTSYTFKGAFTVGDNANRTAPANSNKFGLAQLYCKIKYENGAFVKDGTTTWNYWANMEQYLPTDNEYSYTPTSNYHPATKKYVDDTVDTKTFQYSTMPTASASNEGKIVQYIGTTSSTYTNGYFYECVSDGQSTPTYSWEAVSVQASSGGTTYTGGTNITIDNNNAINCDIPYSLTAANQATFGSSSALINEMKIYTSLGAKTLATEDYVTSAISTAITSALGGSY